MKTDFNYSLIKRLIDDLDFVLLQDQEGNYLLDRPICVLAKNTYGTYQVVELVDGDYLSADQLAARLEQNKRVLTESKKKNQFIWQIVIFDGIADTDKLEAIKGGSFLDARGGRSIESIIVELSSGKASKLFPKRRKAAGIIRSVEKALNESGNDSPDSSVIIETAIRKEEEYKVEIKAKTPVVTYVLIAINVLVFAAIYIYSAISGKTYNELIIDLGAKVNIYIIAGEYWRLVTPIFLHGGIVHLLVNCYSLYALGSTAERLLGRKKYLWAYFVAGVIGNIFSFAFSQNAGVGASGAIFGLLGAMLYLGMERPAFFKASFARGVITTIVINLAYGFSNAGIDNFAHIGGLIGGFLASGVVGVKVKNRWYFNRFIYIVLAAAIAVSGFALGFGNRENNAILKYNRMVDSYNEQDWSGVETAGEEILKLEPENEDLITSALWLLSYSEAVSGKSDEALEHADELVALDPAKGHYMRGLIYYDIQQFDLAKSELENAQQAGMSDEYIDELIEDIESINENS